MNRNKYGTVQTKEHFKQDKFSEKKTASDVSLQIVCRYFYLQKILIGNTREMGTGTNIPILTSFAVTNVSYSTVVNYGIECQRVA